MIIRSIRLKNIKSYGEGPDGEGVIVSFEPGINRIAGQNGHGKSTLIESLGYALFLTNPLHEETFDAATYLLRAGTRAGEIDVTFDYNGLQYRLERGVGSQSKRRSKVILIEDGSTEAEGDAEVTAYLYRLFGLTSAVRLQELFSKLAGVKQGRLTWPFDSKGADARKYFEPLLDVEIFRQCFIDLKPVWDQFELFKHEGEVELAGVEERIRERADSARKTQDAKLQVDVFTGKAGIAQAAKEDAEKEKNLLEQKELKHRTAQNALQMARHQLEVIGQKRAIDQQRLKESHEAREIVASTREAFEAYQKAEQALGLLQKQQQQKTRLQKERDAVSRLEVQWKEKAEAARALAKTHTDNKEARQLRANELRDQIARAQKALQESESAFKTLAESTHAAKQAQAALHHWNDTLREKAKAGGVQVQRICEMWKKIAAFDAKAPAKARVDEKQAATAAKELAKKAAELQKLQQTWSEQLQEISGGLCPFLREKCRQFDPLKIQADISGLEKERKKLAAELAAAEKAHSTARELTEKLTAEEARLGQLQLSLRDELQSYLDEYNTLFPPSAESHLAAWRGYLPSQAKRLTIQPLAEVSLKDCYASGGEQFEPGRLEQLHEGQLGFTGQVAGALSGVAHELEAGFKQFERQQAERLANEQDLRNGQQQLKETEDEVKALAAKIELSQNEVVKAERAAEQAKKSAGELDAKLKPFEKLDEEMRLQQEIKARHTEAYRRFLGAKSSADTFDERQVELNKSIAAETQAAQEVQSKQEAFTAAQADFDPASLATARKKAEDAGQNLATALAHLDHARNELAREQERLAEWQKACAEKERLAEKLGRLQACLTLTAHARRILQKTAPLVAERLCGSIAMKAQQIFNQINPEPIQLEWLSDRFSLRINPGERRFAMLSGGEQTKLALAMTLAMLREFSNLRFCVFDEPTYGVDADSRQKLADAIVRVQDVEENKLDQLLLVSHDDAFEGKIEHVVLIRKTAREGSAPVTV